MNSTGNAIAVGRDASAGAPMAIDWAALGVTLQQRLADSLSELKRDAVRGLVDLVVSPETFELGAAIEALPDRVFLSRCSDDDIAVMASGERPEECCGHYGIDSAAGDAAEGASRDKRGSDGRPQHRRGRRGGRKHRRPSAEEV